MICTRCLHRSPAGLAPLKKAIRTLTTSAPSSASTPPPSTATGSTPFTTPLSGSPPKAPRPKDLPVSSVPAGAVLKGLNYIKGREEIVALPDEEYPEWLWHCLDVEKKDGAGEEFVGDEFSKSKKQRQIAAKRQRKLEAQLAADPESARVKIPIQRQTIDLPGNEQGTVKGAMEAVESRGELRRAMRGDRRAKIKETNFLKQLK